MIFQPPFMTLVPFTTVPLLSFTFFKVHSSYSTHPRESISVFVLYVTPFLRLLRTGWAPLPPLLVDKRMALPKFDSRMSSFELRKMLCSWRLPWRMEFWFIFSTAAAICTKYFHTDLSLKSFPLWLTSFFFRDPMCVYSTTTYKELPSVNES